MLKNYPEILFSNNDKRNILVLICAGLLIRFYGIQYGLPSVYNSTEYFIAKHALSFGARRTLEPLYFIYPTFYVYFIAAIFGFYFFVGRVVGWFSNSSDFAVQFLLDPTLFYLIGRSMNALAMLFATIILFRTIRRFLTTNLALIISLLFLFCYNLFYFTFWMVPDAFLVLGTVIVLFYMVKLNLEDLSISQLILSSIICGLTISCKYNAGFLALGLITAHLIKKDQPFSKRFIRAIVVGILVVIGFLLGSPYWLINFQNFFEGFRTIWSQSQYAYNFEAGLPYIWEIFSIIKTELLLGLILIMLLFLSLFKRNVIVLSNVMIILPTFLIVGSWEKKGLDYLLVIFPPLFVLLGYWVREILNRWPQKKVIVHIVLVFTLIVSFPKILYLNYLYTQKDTRQLTGEWIMENLPPGEKICYDHYHYDIGLIDLERFTRYGEGSQLLSEEIKEKLVARDSMANFYRFVSTRKRLTLSELPDSLYQLAKDDPFLLENFTHPFKSLSEIESEGTQILILNSDTYLKYLENPVPEPDNPLRTEFLKKKKFYQEVFDKYKPIQIFKPDWNRPGPVIQIFKIKG